MTLSPKQQKAKHQMNILMPFGFVLSLLPQLSKGPKPLFIQLVDSEFFSGGPESTLFSLSSLMIAFMWMLALALWFVPVLKRFKARAYVPLGLIVLFNVIFMFTAKVSLDQVAFYESSFLISDLSVFHFLQIALGFTGLLSALSYAGINRGYVALIALSLVWLFPIVFIVLQSFRAQIGFYSPTFIPESFTLQNYVTLFTDTSTFYYGRWFLNTLFVAGLSCLLSTFIIVSISYTLSRLRFKGRKPIINLLLILGMFPGFMAMIAVYYIIKAMGLGQSLFALVLVYSSGAAMTYYVVKGYMDILPRDLDHAARVEGATRFQILVQIIIPLSKPIIIYTLLTTFIMPWADYIFASVILGDNYENYTVAVGLFMMLQNTFIDTWFTRFAAGAVLVSVPIATLFILLRKYYVEGLSTGAIK